MSYLSSRRGNFRGWVLGLLVSVVVLAAAALGGRVLYRLYLETRAYAPPPEGMVFVPAGRFLIGTDDPENDPGEGPLRRAWLPAFYLDRLEVTNRQFAAVFPTHQFPPGEADLPATHVLKSEAQAYARAVHKRLPTGAEWEKGARGTDGRFYPWGNEFRPECANVTDRATAPPPRDGTSCALLPGRKQPGGSFPLGVSLFGAEDMAGNVWEWVEDVQQDRYPWGWPLGEPRGILRGGAYGYGPRQCRCSYRAFEGLLATCSDTGFRCAADAVRAP
ncbi:MAG TPA: SUMF1/EgtB/PvdO family nonheme iron enzyme [Armatimonadota bacterium]|jgi:formylglycine-generating enzyme required for sulfatase activity